MPEGVLQPFRKSLAQEASGKSAVEQSKLQKEPAGGWVLDQEERCCGAATRYILIHGFHFIAMQYLI